jgi:hypothetical protein
MFEIAHSSRIETFITEKKTSRHESFVVFFPI